MEEHLDKLFTEEEPPCTEQEEYDVSTTAEQSESPMAELYKLPSADDETLLAQNASKDAWISRNGRHRREHKGVFYRRARRTLWPPRPILTRLEKVNIEALLIASGQNLKRLVAARDRSPRKLAQAAALRPPDTVGRCRTHLTGRRPF